MTLDLKGTLAFILKKDRNTIEQAINKNQLARLDPKRSIEVLTEKAKSIDIIELLIDKNILTITSSEHWTNIIIDALIENDILDLLEILSTHLKPLYPKDCITILTKEVTQKTVQHAQRLASHGLLPKIEDEYAIALIENLHTKNFDLSSQLIEKLDLGTIDIEFVDLKF